MHDLTGTTEQHRTLVLALLVLAVMLLPALPSVAQVARPGPAPTEEAAPTPTPTATPTPAPTPTPEPTSSESVAPPPLGGSGQSLADMIEAFESEQASPEPTREPSTVQAEGGGAQEVVEAPQVPQPTPAASVAPAEAGVPTEEAPAPPPIETYGVNVVPSLGTAARPRTGDVVGDPLVLAPMVAGQQVKVDGDVATGQPDKSALLQAADPIDNVAAASLSVVQPSWFATTIALLILLGAATYGAVLQRRGDPVPEAIAFSGAVRPRDHRMATARSVRPADLDITVRSVRP